MSTMLRVVSHLAAALLLTMPLACSGHPDTCCTETVSRTTVQGECGNTGCRLRCCGGGKTVQGECCKKKCCPRCGKECCRHCGQCPRCLDFGSTKPDLKDGKCRCTACECGTTGKCTCTSGGKRLKDPCVCRCGCLGTGKCVCTPDKAR